MDDPFVPVNEIEAFKTELNSGGVDWQMQIFSGAVHSFTQPMAGNDNTRGAAYNEKKPTGDHGQPCNHSLMKSLRVPLSKPQLTSCRRASPHFGYSTFGVTSVSDSRRDQDGSMC